MIYPCHAGLIEVIAPILVDEVVVGYLLLSHIVQGADEEAEWAHARALCAPYDIPEAELRRAYQQLPRTAYNVLRAAADLLALSARALYLARMARLVPGSPQEKLNRFLKSIWRRSCPASGSAPLWGWGAPPSSTWPRRPTAAASRSRCPGCGSSGPCSCSPPPG